MWKSLYNVSESSQSIRSNIISRWNPDCKYSGSQAGISKAESEIKICWDFDELVNKAFIFIFLFYTRSHSDYFKTKVKHVTWTACFVTWIANKTDYKGNETCHMCVLKKTSCQSKLKAYPTVRKCDNSDIIVIFVKEISFQLMQPTILNSIRVCI